MDLRRRMRLRLVLPIIFLVISVAMVKLGETQYYRILRSAHPTEPLPNWFAVAKFVDYADNAPAWVAAMKMPDLPLGEPLISNPDVPLPQGWYWQKYLYELDWWYRVFLVGMWFLIGNVLDMRRDEKRLARFQTHRWRNRLLQFLCVPYGVFVLLNARFDNYEGWFRAGVLAWGIGLIFAGLCPLSAAGGRVWRVFFGSLLALLGVFESWFGLYLYFFFKPTPLLHAWIPSICTILIWGVTLLLLGLYLLLRSPRSQTIGQRNVLAFSQTAAP